MTTELKKWRRVHAPRCSGRLLTTPCWLTACALLWQVGVAHAQLKPVESSSGTPVTSPVLVAPAHQAGDAPLRPYFDWESNSDEFLYFTLQLSTDPDMQTLLFSVNTNRATYYQLDFDLEPLVTYYWRVRAYVPYRPGGSWSAVSTFTTDLQSPTVRSPGRYAFGMPVTAGLYWYPVPGALSYDVSLRKTSTWHEEVVSVTGTDYHPVWQAGQVYSWKVRSVAAAGVSEWSGERIIGIEEPPPPPAPALYAPADYSQNVSPLPVLQWADIDGASGYRLQVARSSDFATPVLDTQGDFTGATIGTGRYMQYWMDFLAYGETYYWRVQATGPGGTGPWSGTWRFTIVPPPFVVTSPAFDDLPVAGAVMRIRWTGGPSLVRVQLHRDGRLYHEITSKTSGDGAYNWTVPGSIHAGGGYSIRIVDRNDPDHRAEGSTFTIGNSAPHGEITVTHPQVAAAWTTGKTYTIQWEDNIPDLVQVALYRGNSRVRNLVYDTPENTLEWTVPQTMSPGTDYRFKVQSRALGAIYDFSDDFTIRHPDPAPAAPALILPLQETAEAPYADLVLQWSEVEGATRYIVHLDHAPIFVAPVMREAHLTGTSVTAPPLDPERDYYWRVKACNRDDVCSPWSEIRTFRTRAEWAPLVPMLLEPEDEATEVPASVTLEWSRVAIATHYELRVRDDAEAVRVDTTMLTENTYALTSLEPATTYTWSVRTCYQSLCSLWTTNVFTTAESPFMLTVPQLDAPQPGATGVSTTPTFYWYAVSGATRYHLQVTSRQSFSPSLPDIDRYLLGQLSAQVSFLAHNTQYRWRIAACMEDTCGPWSEERTFTTQAVDGGGGDPGGDPGGGPGGDPGGGPGGDPVDLPAPPVLLEPAVAATGVSVEPALIWQPVAGAAHYEVELYHTQEGAYTLVADSVTSAASMRAGQLLYGAAYAWRVRSCSAAGCGAWSHPSPGGAAFYTRSGPLAAPGLLAPPEGAAGVAVKPLLAWSRTPHATHYRVELTTDSTFTAPPDTSYTFPDSLLVDDAGMDTLLADTKYFTTALATQIRADTSLHPTGVFLPHPLAAQTRYWWRLRAVDVYDLGPWSEARSFQTDISGVKRYYYLADHLGSVRATVNERGTVVHADDYFPFGQRMPNRSSGDGNDADPTAKPRFTGHELDWETDLVYAGARYYDPELGRWLSVDPLADEYPSWSPYNYVMNNPVRLVDPDGAAPSDCPSCGVRIDNRVKQYLSGEVTRQQYISETTLGLNQAAGAVGDFVRNYKDMREANTIGADKYYHCKANCEASQRGEVGKGTATLISNLREFLDRLVKGDPAEASEADQEANRHGRENADTGECTEACESFRPDALGPERTNEDSSEEEEQKRESNEP